MLSINDKQVIETKKPTIVSLSANPNFLELGWAPAATLDKDADATLNIKVNTGVRLGLNNPNLDGRDPDISMIKVFPKAKTVWFDLNSLVKNQTKHSTGFLHSTSWVDTGTVSDRCHFVNYLGNNIYESDVMYAITGHARGLGNNDLSGYIYNNAEGNIVEPLTTRAELYHVRGQSQYFNFILSDPKRGQPGEHAFPFSINYRLYSQSKKLLASVFKHSVRTGDMYIANTLKLDIDGVIGNRDNVAFVEVCLCKMFKDFDDPITISTPMLFNTLPEYLYKVNDFAFLNSLGGWSSFNFSGAKSTDFKASPNTYTRSQTPSYNISDSIETVYSKDVTETFIVQTMPVNEVTAYWLRELATSIAVYEIATKRYIVVDDLHIKTNSNDDLYRIEMKYRYSDAFNRSSK